MVNAAVALRTLYTRYVVSHPLDGALGAVADLLAEGNLSRETFDAIVREYPDSKMQKFRDGLLDIVIHAIRASVSDHCLTTDEVQLVKWMTGIFRIREGEFYTRRRQEVADVIQAEVYRLLDDEIIDITEAAYQDELQRLLGLSYDQYLELARDAVTPVVNRMIARIGLDGVVTSAERARFDRQLAALQTVYVLSPAQRRALGGG